MGLPQSYAGLLAEGAVITQGFERNLLVFTASAYQQIYRQVMSLNRTDPLVRLLLRLLVGTACELPAAGQARVTIPAALRQFAGLAQEAVVVGQGDCLEIWSPEAWTIQLSRLEDVEANAQRFSGFDLSLN